MNAVIPWVTVLALIEPHYPKAARGRQPIGAAPRCATAAWPRIWPAASPSSPSRTCTWSVTDSAQRGRRVSRDCCSGEGPPVGRAAHAGRPFRSWLVRRSFLGASLL